MEAETISKTRASLKSHTSKGNNKNKVIMKVYKKPAIVAENKVEGTFAAACPPQNHGSAPCSSCETTV